MGEMLLRGKPAGICFNAGLAKTELHSFRMLPEMSFILVGLTAFY